MKRLQLTVALLFALTRVSALTAQATTPTTVIRTATMIDGTGTVRRNVDIHVRDGKIVAIQPSTGRADINLGNRVLAPGLIDTHVHLGWYINSKGRLHQNNDGDDERTDTDAFIRVVFVMKGGAVHRQAPMSVGPLRKFP